MESHRPLQKNPEEDVIYVFHNGCPDESRELIVKTFLESNDIKYGTRIVIHENAIRLIKNKKGIKIPGIHFVFTESAVQLLYVLEAIEGIDDTSIINLRKSDNEFFESFNNAELRQ